VDDADYARPRSWIHRESSKIAAEAARDGVVNSQEMEASVLDSSLRCFACDSKDVAPSKTIPDFHAGTGRHYSLNICRACGSGRLREKLTEAELEEIYPPTFYSYEVSEPENPLLALIYRIRYDRHRFKPTFKRLLEIGSGYGEFLATIAHRGSVVGLERSPAARMKASSIGLDVRVGDVADAALFRSGEFDYAYLSHSFEHLDDPSAALKSIATWLEDDGHLFMAIPNFGGALPRIFRGAWYNLAVPLHVSQFTRRGISSLLENNGFVVERIGFNSDPLSIPMTLYFASGRTTKTLRSPLTILVMAVALSCIPISRLMDWIGVGDCIEVWARKRPSRATH
jgi:SAM-dependent methyltransferase